MKRLMISAALALLAGTAWGQEPLDEGVVVSELVVRPATTGPAWWRVSDEDSAVYVLIVPGVSVSDRPWDKTVVERRMRGANVFIVPFQLSLANPRSIVGMGAVIAQTPKLLIAPKPKALKKDPNRPALEETLPGPLRTRFVALRTEMSQPAERYAALSPLEAARLMERDYRAHLKITGAGDDLGGASVRRIEDIAKREKVKVEAAWKLVIPPVKLKVGKTDEAPLDKQVSCLDGALTRLQARGQADRHAYIAWSEGDVRPLLRRPNWPVEPGCTMPTMSLSTGDSPAMRKVEESFVADEVAAIERALKKPGRSLAVLEPLSPLGNAELGMLGRRGVLERLRAKGYEITAPDGLGDD
jgi:hypothetical protein